MEILLKLERVEERLNPYERAVVYGLQGKILSHFQDYRGAVDSYKKILDDEDQRVVPLRVRIDAFRRLAVLSIKRNNHADAVQYMDAFMGYSSEVAPEMYYLRAKSNREIKNFDAALSDINSAIASQVSESNQVSREWYNIKLALQFIAGNYMDLLESLSEVSELYPEYSSMAITRAFESNGNFSSGDHKLLFSVSPEYPRSALFKGVQGVSVVEYDIDQYGTVLNPRVIDAYTDDGVKTSIFNRPALNAVSAWLYKPKVVNGRAVGVHNVRKRVRFAIVLKHDPDMKDSIELI